MNVLTPLLALTILAAACAADPPAKDKPARKPNFTVSRETTYVTGPLDKDGCVDYATAIDERLGKGVTPETNANVLIWKALGPRPLGGKPMPAQFFKPMGMDEPPEKGEYFVDVRPFVRDRLGIEDREQFSAAFERIYPLTHEPWKVEDHRQIAEWLKSNEKPLNLVVEGLNRPHYFAPVYRGGDEPTVDLVTAYFARTSAALELTTALAVRGMLRVGEGKPADAWPDLLACQRMGRYVGRGVSLIEALVGFRCESIGQRATEALLERPELDARQLARFLRDLRALPPIPLVSDHLEIGERFVALERFTIAIRGGSDTVNALTRGAIHLPPEVDIDWNRALRNMNAYFDQMGAALRHKDRGKRQREFDRIEAELQALEKARGEDGGKSGKGRLGAGAAKRDVGESIVDILTALTLPAVRKIQEAYDRTEQGHQNLQIALASAGYQRDRKKYPETLEALVPKYLEKLPDDLFTGKPLIYKPSENGFLLYSLGPNGKDDDGRGPGDNPKGDDVAIRIPVPKPKNK